MTNEQQNAKRRKKRADRKARGLCGKCGEKLAPGKTYCEKCAENARQDKIYYLSMGFCGTCHKYRVFGTEKECPECKARRSISQRKCLEKARLEGKEWALPETLAIKASERQQRLKSMGICISCGKRPAEESRTMCRICLDKRAKYMRERRLWA